MKRYKIKVTGIVQGVGFRPFVHTLAKKLLLSGTVLNTPSGVVIEAEGEDEELESFLDEIRNNPPVLARVDKIVLQEIEPTFLKGFQIVTSDSRDEERGFISADMAMCDDCFEDINNKNSRFYRYPFTNCTNCGPRYTIIKALPYDRENTSMEKFTMCDECRKEYEDPTNRRFHAEPISCPNCGVSLTLFDKEQNKIEGDPLQKCVDYIEKGKIVAIKGLGGFHLICDALNSKAVSLLRERKRRAKKPFAVMFKNLEEIKKCTKISTYEEGLIDSFEKPIVIVKKAENSLFETIAPGIDRLGVFLPYTPLHRLLLDELENPIIATSANLKGDGIIYKAEDIFEKLGGVVDFVLDNDREIINPCDDSIVQEVGGKSVILRGARGFAPASFVFNDESGEVLGVGAHQKSTITLRFGKKAVLSPFIGDLESVENTEYFKKTLKSFQEFYSFTGKSAVRDLHSDYFSSRYVEDLQYEKIQHHYAHVLSAMAEKNIDEEVLGVVFDGTGLGDDGTVWGGEFLLCTKEGYKRVGHLKPFKLLGSAASIKDIGKIAISKLLDLKSVEEILELDLEVVKSFTKKEIETLKLIHQKGINSPLTSSMGRLFDMVAALSGICTEQSYEGETGLRIESYYDSKIEEFYPFTIEEGVVDFDEMIEGMIKAGSKKVIASKFINTLVQISIEFAKRYGKLTIFSGGVFQNRTLLEKMCKEFERENLSYTFQEKTAMNDGSLSLGQVYFVDSSGLPKR